MEKIQQLVSPSFCIWKSFFSLVLHYVKAAESTRLLLLLSSEEIVIVELIHVKGLSFLSSSSYSTFTFSLLFLSKE